MASSFKIENFPIVLETEASDGTTESQKYQYKSPYFKGFARFYCFKDICHGRGIRFVNCQIWNWEATIRIVPQKKN